MRALSITVYPLLFVGLLSCGDGGANDTGPFDPECGDLDGIGTDTGNLPNIIGSWTVTVGKWYFKEDCGLSDDELTGWINGAMDVKGRVPDSLYAQFDDEGERFHGIESGHGGVVFSGIHNSDEYGELSVALGGLLYTDVYRDKIVIEGFAFIGIDSTGDGEIDCPARGDFEAFKSSL